MISRHLKGENYQELRLVAADYGRLSGSHAEDRGTGGGQHRGDGLMGVSCAGGPMPFAAFFWHHFGHSYLQHRDHWSIAARHAL